VRKIIVFSLMLAVLCAAAAFAFNPDELNKVTIQNTTGTKIDMIFLSPGDSEYWGPDIIGADYVMKDSSSLGYYLHYPEKTFKFDIMAIDDKGNKFEQRNLEITDGTELTIKLTKKNLNATAPDLTLATVHLDNATGHEIEYLFLSPNDSDAWGVDLLDEETTLVDGDTHNIVVPIGKDKVKYNLMAVDENNDTYKFNITLDPAKTSKEFNWAIEESDLSTGK
jgi:hypothetical protein